MSKATVGGGRRAEVGKGEEGRKGELRPSPPSLLSPAVIPRRRKDVPVDRYWAKHITRASRVDIFG